MLKSSHHLPLIHKNLLWHPYVCPLRVHENAWQITQMNHYSVVAIFSAWIQNSQSVLIVSSCLSIVLFFLFPYNPKITQKSVLPAEIVYKSASLGTAAE